MGQAGSFAQRLVVTTLALFGIMAISIGSLSCSQRDYSGKAESVTVGLPGLEQDALIYIADEQKLFAANGLKVVIKDYDSGVASLKAMTNGEADIAEAAEFPFVGATFQKEQIRLIATDDTFENDYIAARKDRGIERISDLKGKRIGVALQTITEFYLGRFLELHSMKMQDITLVDIKPAQFVSAIASGDIDAIIAWQPYISQIEKEVNGVVVWPAQSSQAVYSILACRSEWLAQHADTVQRFLKSLSEAADYLVRHEKEAKAIVQKRLNYDDAYIARVWPQHQFSLSLDQTLIVAMKDEAQWMINNNLTTEKTIPDFPDYVSVVGLKSVKPEVVNITR